MAIFSSYGAFGMFCFVSVLCGMLGAAVGRGLVLSWDDVHNEAPEPRIISHLVIILTVLGSLTPAAIAFINVLRTST